MSGNDSLYTLTDVTKQYGSRQVVNVQSLTVTRGEVLALVGPSGAGKSTLLRLLNFLETPSSGQLVYNQFKLNGSPPPLNVQRTITTVFQRSILLNRSVAENVSLGLRLRGRRQVKTRVDDLLQQVGMEHLAGSPARALSGGETQRVALARALAINPVALLLDEPTANLDPYNVMVIEKLVQQINRQQGVTIVLVTHNVFQARRLADRTALILDGEIVEVGPTESLFESPQDPRTAAFINGEMIY